MRIEELTIERGEILDNGLMRIPVMSITDSSRSRSLIPLMSITDSGRSRSLAGA